MCISLGLRLMRQQQRSNAAARAGYPGYTPGQDYAPQPIPVNNGALQQSYEQPNGNGQPVSTTYVEPNKTQ